MRNPRLRLFVATLATLAVVLAVVAAGAQARRWRPRPPPPAPSFSMHLEDGGGSRLQTFRQGATTWVMGEQGDRFVIVLQNPTAQRVEAVVSVDGRDVLSGRVANFRTQRGYIVPAFGSTRIEGFRQSLDHVATFRFGGADDSYSARMGTPQNVGVIGVAFFRERVVEQPIAGPFEERQFRRPAPAKTKRPSAGARPRAAESDSNLGTEYGETRMSQVREVPFDRISNTPTRVITLRYDDAAGLEARGIDTFHRPRPRPVPFAPVAFPEPRFAPPPP